MDSQPTSSWKDYLSTLLEGESPEETNVSNIQLIRIPLMTQRIDHKKKYSQPKQEDYNEGTNNRNNEIAQIVIEELQKQEEGLLVKIRNPLKASQFSSVIVKALRYIEGINFGCWEKRAKSLPEDRILLAIGPAENQKIPYFLIKGARDQAKKDYLIRAVQQNSRACFPLESLEICLTEYQKQFKNKN